MSGGNSQEMQYEQMETSDTGIHFSQAFTQMDPVIATVLGKMKQWSAFNRQTDDPRIGGVCISDEMNIVLMSKEQYGKILEEIKIPNVTTTREDIIRVREAMIELYGLGHNPKSPIRELSLIITGKGWKRSCRGLKFFPANLLGSETTDKHLVGVSN